MPKFQALYNIKELSVPFVEKDAEGNITRDESIVFNRGMNAAKGFIPAYIHVSDTATLNYLRAYPGNKTNGGYSYEEVQEEPEPVNKPEQQEFPVYEPGDEPKQEPEPVEPKAKVYEDVTTVNEASQILLEMFEELVTRDVNTRAKIAAVAASKGLSFPNL
jgi:hypothetical protein